MKKMFAALLTGAIVLSMGATTAFAHGHGRGHYAGYAASTTSYPICTVEGCELGYTHLHDGTYYCGHTYGDGHDHAYCGVSGCTQSGIHTHGGCGNGYGHCW